MILDPAVAAAILAHLPNELGAMAAYRALASSARDAGYLASAAWFDAAGTEEVGHHLRLLNYLRDHVDGPVVPDFPAADVGSLPASLAEAYQAALGKEFFVHASLQGIVDVARGARDEATARFIGTFLDEQVAAEAEIMDRIRQVRALSPDAVLLWDMERGE